MNLIRFKRYIGLCQCKGCMRPYDVRIAMYFHSGQFYPAHLCNIHACDAITDPFISVGRF